MKTYLFLFLLALSFFQTNAQSSKSCGFDEVMKAKMDSDPILKAACLYRLQNPVAYPNFSSATVYTIPVVFHILHLGGSENISDAQVLDALAILNQDFRKQNPDTASILAPFQAADVHFEFRLATKDTNGNCTTGIVRHYTSLANWDILPQNYIYTWDPTRYLNIYTVKSIPTFNNTGAYAYAPGSTGPAEDVIVAIHDGIGSIGTGTPLHARGLTHEVGHWFDLMHIWGNGSPGITCGDDGIADTPITKGFLTCPSTTMAICTPGVAENHQNYEDYSGCGKMFTAGQAAHMNAVINGTLAGRNNLSTNANLIATGIINPLTPCQPIADFGCAANLFTVCAGQNVTFNDYSYNGSVSTRAWAATGGALISNSTAIITSIVFTTPGVQTVSLQVSNSVGSSISTKTVLILNNVTNIPGSYFESFETNGLPPNFNVIDTAGVAWAQTSLAAASGNRCFFIDGSGEPAKDVNILETPAYDFLNNQGSAFSFKYAYAKYSASNTDVFKVQASMCGAAWTDIYLPNNNTLSSGSGGVLAASFYPTPSQFKTYVLSDHPSFTPFLNMSSVKIRFYFKEDSISGHGNNFFLDDLNFETPNGIKENSLQKAFYFQLYPNPSSGDAEMNFDLNDQAYVNYFITDITGRIIEKQEIVNLPAGTHNFKLNRNKILSAGLYLVNLKINDQTVSRKLIIE